MSADRLLAKLFPDPEDKKIYETLVLLADGTPAMRDAADMIDLLFAAPRNTDQAVWLARANESLTTMGISLEVLQQVYLRARLEVRKRIIEMERSIICRFPNREL